MVVPRLPNGEFAPLATGPERWDGSLMRDFPRFLVQEQVFEGRHDADAADRDYEEIRNDMLLDMWFPITTSFQLRNAPWEIRRHYPSEAEWEDCMTAHSMHIRLRDLAHRMEAELATTRILHEQRQRFHQELVAMLDLEIEAHNNTRAQLQEQEQAFRQAHRGFTDERIAHLGALAVLQAERHGGPGTHHLRSLEAYDELYENLQDERAAHADTQGRLDDCMQHRRHPLRARAARAPRLPYQGLREVRQDPSTSLPSTTRRGTRLR
jgi:hypothetical protein